MIFDTENCSVGIEFYMKDANTEPDKDNSTKKLSLKSKRLQGIPRGSYSVMLNDNLIDRKRGIGAKENTLGISHPIKLLRNKRGRYV